MSILNFSEDQFFTDLRSDSQEVNLGSFIQDRTTKLGNVRLLVYLQGVFTDEQITLHVKDNPDAPSTDFTATLNPVDVPDVGTHWLGWIRFDFNKEFLVKDTQYFLTIESSNYTESASKYIGVAFDYPNVQNEQVGGSWFNNYCSKFQLYGLE
jgi:hypothetical protein